MLLTFPSLSYSSNFLFIFLWSLRPKKSSSMRELRSSGWARMSAMNSSRTPPCFLAYSSLVSDSHPSFSRQGSWMPGQNLLNVALRREKSSQFLLQTLPAGSTLMWYMMQLAANRLRLTISWLVILASRAGWDEKASSLVLLQATLSTKFSLIRFASGPLCGLFAIVFFLGLSMSGSISDWGWYSTTSFILMSDLAMGRGPSLSFSTFFFFIYCSVMMEKVLNLSKFSGKDLLSAIVAVLKYSKALTLLLYSKVYISLLSFLGFCSLFQGAEEGVFPFTGSLTAGTYQNWELSKNDLENSSDSIFFAFLLSASSNTESNSSIAELLLFLVAEDSFGAGAATFLTSLLGEATTGGFTLTTSILGGVSFLSGLFLMNAFSLGTSASLFNTSSTVSVFWFVSSYSKFSPSPELV